MSAERLIATHLRLAAEAVTAARALDEIENRNAVYLAEQAVEQVILALAQSEGVAFTRSQNHQLEAMRKALPETNIYREDLRQVTWLEAYATTFRYPKTMGGLTEPPPAEKLRAAVATAADLTERVAAHFGVDLDLTSKRPASHARPPR